MFHSSIRETTMLKMTNLSKAYRTEVVETYALRDFSIHVREGEFVAVTGPSGSGKTTFLTIAGLLEEFSGGEYQLDGADVRGLNDNQRSRLRNEKIGFIFQAFNLIPDLSVSGSYSHLGTGTGGFSQPPDNTLGASLSLNLPFSRLRHRGELEAAQATHTQAELQLHSTQLQVEQEVRDAYSRYQAAVQRLNLYRGGMLKDADRVLEARLYAYQRGGATLLEVIDAQRTSAEVYLAYSQALSDHAHALVTLELASAIWDVSF